MIAITSTTFDTLGYLIANTFLNVSESRRATATKTLDGGISVDDAGFNSGDEEASIEIVNPTQDQVERARRMVSIHNSHKLYAGASAYDGVLMGAIFSPGSALSLRFQITNTEN